VTFDPFGDFVTEGYLRNFEKETSWSHLPPVLLVVRTPPPSS
jgi:hypothetical protein